MHHLFMCGMVIYILCQQYYVLPIVMSIDIFLFCETIEGRIAYHWKIEK